MDDRRWFCSGSNKMTRSHVLLHYSNPRLRAARMEAWEGKDPGGVWCLVSQSQVGEVICKVPRATRGWKGEADGTDEDAARAAKMGLWVVWESVERTPPGA